MRYLIFTLLALVICNFAEAQTANQIPNTPIYYTSDYVGIGNSQPTAKLDILGSGDSRLKLGLDDAHAHHILSYRDLVFNSNNGFIFRHNPVAGDVENFTEILSLNTNGRVGIGTRTPTEILDVRGNVVLNTINARDNRVLKIVRGADGKDRAQINFYSGGITNNFLDWSIGTSYSCGQARDYFVISSKDYLNDCSNIHIPEFTILKNGNIGIGTRNITEKLTVDGTILAEEVKVQNVPQSDYVFEPDYNLLPLTEVETFIKENKHLPEIPSAEEFKENGVGLGEMDDMLLRKVEELTLYVIELKNENEQLQIENSNKEAKIDSLEEKVDMILEMLEASK